MIITISNTTKAFMKILNLHEYPFTEKELKTAYLAASKINHPDKGGHISKMQKINEAFAALDPLSLQDITKKEKEAEHRLQTKALEEDIFKVYDSCSNCAGTGIITHTESILSNCTDCSGVGFHEKIVKCKYCSGTGEFKLRSGRFVTCNKCAGSGIFQILKQKCSSCAGKGVTYKKDNIYETYYSICKGTGKVETKVYNPVIRKGSVLI